MSVEPYYPRGTFPLDSGKRHSVEFLDSGRSPRCQPNPSYPEGVHVNLAKPRTKACVVAVPYPAPRCGAMVVKCKDCGGSAAVTVAGRQDDPRTVALECHAR